jgi:GR25 family glycosyltransferase involved in LPS biosynthesis
LIPAYLINLNREKSRLESAIAEAAPLDIQMVRISAVDMHQLDHQEICFVTNGVRAAWLSHMLCLKTFLETKSEFALILEDDFSIKNSKIFNEELETLLRLSPDVVQFGFLVPGVDTRIKILISNIENLFFRKIAFFAKIVNHSSQSRLRVRRLLNIPRGYVTDDFQPGAHCYLVSRKAAEIILLLNSPQYLSIDDFLTGFARMRSLKFLRRKRSISGQKPFAPWQGERFKSG